MKAEISWARDHLQGQELHRKLDTLIIKIIIGDRVSHLPTQGMKVPGSEDGLEDGTDENIEKQAINCRWQVLGYQLLVRIAFIHNRNTRAFFCDVFIQK